MSFVIIARSVPEIEALRAHWHRLYCRGDYTLFQDFDWNLLAARFFASRESPFVVYAEVAGGAAIVPAAVRPGNLGLLGETLFDYRDVLWAGDPEALELAVTRLAELGLPLDVTAVRDGDASRAWREGYSEKFCRAPAVSPQDLSAEQFRALHTGIGRHIRRLQRAGGRFRRYPGSDTQQVRRVLDQKAEYADDDNLLRDPLRRDFLAAAAALHPGQAEVFTLEIEAQVAAGLLTFRDRNTRRFYTITYDRRWSGYSPGNALLCEVVAQSLDEGLECDFMTGEQPYKLRFATRSVPLYRIHAPAGALACSAPAARAA